MLGFRESKFETWPQRRRARGYLVSIFSGVTLLGTASTVSAQQAPAVTPLLPARAPSVVYVPVQVPADASAQPSASHRHRASPSAPGVPPHTHLEASGGGHEHTPRCFPPEEALAPVVVDCGGPPPRIRTSVTAPPAAPIESDAKPAESTPVGLGLAARAEGDRDATQPPFLTSYERPFRGLIGAGIPLIVLGGLGTLNHAVGYAAADDASTETALGAGIGISGAMLVSGIVLTAMAKLEIPVLRPADDTGSVAVRLGPSVVGLAGTF